MNRVVTTAGQVQVSELRIELAVVRDRRNYACLEHLDRNNLLDTDTHGVPGETLRVGHQDLVGRTAEYLLQCGCLRLSATAPGRRVGLVRDEDGVGCDLTAIETVARLCVSYEGLHDLGDVMNVQAAAVERTIGHNGAKHLTNGLHASFSDRACGFENHGAGTHADNQPVTTPVEGNGGVLYVLIGGGGAAGQKARADPLDQIVAGGVVGGDHDDAAAATSTNPVFRQTQRLAAASTGRIDLGVGTTGDDHLGELRVPESQDLEEEAPIEDVGIFIDPRLEVLDLAFDFLSQSVLGICSIGELILQLDQGLELLPTRRVSVESLDFIKQGIVAGKRRREDDTRVILHFLGQAPTVGQLRPLGGRLVAPDQRYAGIPERVDPSRDRQLRNCIERRQTILRKAVFLGEVKNARSGR